MAGRYPPQVVQPVVRRGVARAPFRGNLHYRGHPSRASAFHYAKGAPTVRGRANNYVSFAQAHPDLTSQWHPTKNNRRPEEVSKGSSYRAWWTCPIPGHPDFEQVVSKRHAGQGCPKCSVARRAAKRRTPERGRSLADLHPELVSEWSQKNQLNPHDLKPQSHLKVWWVCPTEEHPDYEKSPNTRLSENSGCPRCGNRRKGEFHRRPQKGKSFADVHPYLVDEWSARNRFRPFDLKPGSDELVSWTCRRCGHQWRAAVKARSRGSGCFRCAVEKRALQSRKPTPGQSLADLYPAVARQWHPHKNGALTPKDFKARSQFTATWKCAKGSDHEWAAIIAERTGSANRPGTGCPYCPTSRRPKASTTNNLSLRIDLIADLHPTKNGDFNPQSVTVSSRKRLWWKCNVCGDEKQMSVNARAQLNGCLGCNPARRSMREIRLECELLAVLDARRRSISRLVPVDGKNQECDIVLPNIRVVVEYDGLYWHKDRVREDRRKTKALRDSGWTVIRVREAPLKRISGHDIQIAPTTPIKAVADSVLKALIDLDLVASDAALRYLTRTSEVATRRADREIARLRRPKGRRIAS